MTGYNDIRDAIMTELNTACPIVNIHGEEVQQGFKRPAFYVQLIPESGSILNPAHRQKNILVDICYFSTDGKGREAWGIADGLDEMFSASIIVGDRELFINDPHPEIIDKVLHYQFSLSYTDSGDGISVELDNGEEAIMLPEPETGYTDGEVLLMRELEIKGE